MRRAIDFSNFASLILGVTLLSAPLLLAATADDRLHGAHRGALLLEEEVAESGDNCSGITSGEATFSVQLRGVVPSVPGDCPVPEEPPDDCISIPDGRPVYAFLVSGYTGNESLQEVHFYRFAEYLMENWNAYVHWSWWNNLLAPYMTRPLHGAASDPGNSPFGEGPAGFIPKPGTVGTFEDKAVPEEDHQFQEDLRSVVKAIRMRNPCAMIVLVGHSMGGASVARFASTSGALLDLVGLIDPVENRSWPLGSLQYGTFNWTRSRIAREDFLGYKQSDCSERTSLGGVCKPFSTCVPADEDWRCTPPEIGLWAHSRAPEVCGPFTIFAHDPPARVFGGNVLNLYHRWQTEAPPPVTDFVLNREFKYDHKHQSINDQECSETRPPRTLEFACVPNDIGPGTPSCLTDGHTEIVSHLRHNITCDLGGENTDGITAKGKVNDEDECIACCQGLEDPTKRETRIREIRDPGPWGCEPDRPDLCLVSPGLIDIFERMNKPPEAEAGPDQQLDCTGPAGAEVTLDGSGSTDPEDDPLEHIWFGPFRPLQGETVTVTVPIGTHEITLSVSDPIGHQCRDKLEVTVIDTPPELDVSLSPSTLWPPNHKLVDIEATVEAHDLCGEVVSVELVSITSNESERGGDGNTSDDFQGAEYSTLDTSFQLRSERSGKNTGRVYTVTYRATDDAGNTTETSAEVRVAHDRGSSEKPGLGEKEPPRKQKGSRKHGRRGSR